MAPLGRTGAAPLHDIVARTRPVASAGDQVLPLLPGLTGMLPWAGLRRGSTVAVRPGAAATSLALAVAAGPSKAGSWCATVGLPSVGLVAAVEMGIDLARFPMIAAPAGGREWAAVVAAVVDAFDVVLVQPPSRVRAADGRRLAARARERGGVLVVLGEWEGADVRLAVRRAVWHGLERGHGHLRSRLVDVVVEGRGAAARPRRVSLWLPDEGGEVRRATGVRRAEPSGRREVRVAG